MLFVVAIVKLKFNFNLNYCDKITTMMPLVTFSGIDYDPTNTKHQPSFICTKEIICTFYFFHSSSQSFILSSGQK